MEFKKQYDRKLILEDGSVYEGWGFGSTDDRVCELVFNTSMVGYQELISDPTVTDLAVVMSYPLIGSYGITDEDFESRTPTLGALIVGEYNDHPSNFRCTKTLSEIMEENHIPGVEILDTRKLTRRLRDNGSCRVLITGAQTTVEEGLAVIADTPVPTDAVARVSCKKRWYARTPDHLYNVAAVDCGIKLSFVRALNSCGCNVTVVPCTTDAQTILAMKPDGLFVSNGPGNPEDLPGTVSMIRELRGKLPIFGVGMGCELIALAYGAKVYKMPHDHRGGYSVRNLETGRLETTGQDHGYAVEAGSLKDTSLVMTHVNLLDHTVEGIACSSDRVFAVQYHPECAPGMQDSAYLFEQFLETMKEEKTNA